MDEQPLWAKLLALSAEGRTAFAACCAEQLFPYYEMFCKDEAWDPNRALRHGLNRAWQRVTSRTPISKEEFAALDAAILDVGPDVEEKFESVWTDVARDACIATSRALECASTGEVKSAVAAAEGAYEACLGVRNIQTDDEDVLEPDSPDARLVTDGINRILDAVASFGSGPIDIDAVRSIRILETSPPRSVYR